MTRRTAILFVALASASCGEGSSAESGGSTSTAAETSTTANTTRSTTTTEGSTTSTTSAGESSSGTITEGSSSAVDESSSSETGIGDCHPLLVEVLYDAVEGDVDHQWVKLYNPCSGPIELSSYAIGYGGPDYVPDIPPPDGVKTLQGSIDAGGCWIVGGPDHDATNGDPMLEFAETFAPPLDLAIDVGAGVALFDVPAAMVDTSTVPIDAVVYGPNNDNGLIDDTGQPVAQPHVAGTIAGGSIRRTALAATWEAADVPTAGECPPF
jgi:hypothetical protein